MGLLANLFGRVEETPQESPEGPKGDWRPELRAAARIVSWGQCHDFEFDKLWDCQQNYKWCNPRLAPQTIMAAWEKEALALLVSLGKEAVLLRAAPLERQAKKSARELSEAGAFGYAEIE